MRLSSEKFTSSFLERLTVFLFFIAVAVSVTHALWANDVWWHLKTGEWILRHRTVPRIDLYSYTVSNHPWLDLSWGFQLLLYIFYNVFGVNGIIFFKVSIVTVTFILLFRFFYPKIGLSLLLPILSITLLATHERLVERPEILSYFFLVFYLLIVEKNRLKPTKLLYVLPLLQILWVNTHALFILGLLILISNCLGELLSWLSSRGKERVSFPKRECLVAVASCCVTVVNPYGLQGALFPLTLFGRINGELQVFTMGIREFARPLAQYDLSLTLFLYKFLLIAGLFSFLLNHKRFPPAHGILFFTFAYLSLLARRNIAPFSFVACFLILKNLEGLFSEKPHFLERLQESFVVKRMKPVFNTGLFAFVLLLPIPFVTHAFYEREEGFYKRFGLGISEHRYCIQAADFIEKSGVSGNFFNSGLEIGDYLLWRFYPDRKVFMDGRLEVYGAHFLEELFQLLNVPSLWPKWVETYRINFCILDHTNERNEGLLRWVFHSPEWGLIYLDEQIAIFIKRIPENREILEKYAVDLSKDSPPLTSGNWIVDLAVADFYGKMGLFDKAEALYRKNLSYFPRTTAIYSNFGYPLRQKGKTREAFSAYRQAAALDPKDAASHYNLGVLSVEMGNEDMALKELRETLKLVPHFGQARYLLGRLYEKRGRVDQAEREYLQVDVYDPAYLSARNALGILYAEKSEYGKAEKEFKDILKVNPNAEGTLQNLKRLETLRRRE